MSKREFNWRMKMTYDYRCYDLAATFLGDEARPSDSPELMDALRKDLAQLIQDTIEGYLEVDLEDMRRKWDAAVKDLDEAQRNEAEEFRRDKV